MVSLLICSGSVSVIDCSYKLNAPSCIAEAVEDDLIVINLATGRYYNMRHETVACWRALSQGVTPADLLAANDWNSVQQASFTQLVQQLVEEQLLIVSSEPAPAGDAPRIECSSGHEPFHVDVFTDMEEMLLLDPIHDASVDTGWPHKA